MNPPPTWDEAIEHLAAQMKHAVEERHPFKVEYDAAANSLWWSAGSTTDDAPPA